jgi:rhomboid family protein
VFPQSYSIHQKLPPAVKGLLLANFAGFLIARLSGPLSFDYLFGLTVPAVFSHFRIYQFITYLFVHGDLFHLLFNMLILYIFGRELELYWGRRYFLRYYFISGIGAGICSIPFIWGINAPLVGASGALFALLVAYGLLFPDRVMVFFILPVRMKARQMVLIFIGLELFFLFNSGGGGGIAHFAHLGGGLVGFIYLKWPVLREKMIEYINSKRSIDREDTGRGHSNSPPRKKEVDLRSELDRILDKLAQVGWEGLSNAEKEFLHDAKNQL